MSATTGIEWTEKTWNPWVGCTQVSPGCAHCYMFREQRRFGNNPEFVRKTKTMQSPLRWREPSLIFTCSWSDWFHEGADAWRDEAWDVIRRAPWHTYQILTKRPERITAHLPADWGAGYPNVWLGVSVENQRHAHRAELLAEIPAAVRFVSAEPLLGPVSLADVFEAGYESNGPAGWVSTPSPIHWVIVGGESGAEHRPMDLAWARVLRAECALYGVAFFLKQLGGWPNKRGGAEAVLDGRTHTAMPARAGSPA